MSLLSVRVLRISEWIGIAVHADAIMKPPTVRCISARLSYRAPVIMKCVQRVRQLLQTHKRVPWAAWLSKAWLTATSTRSRGKVNNLVTTTSNGRTLQALLSIFAQLEACVRVWSTHLRAYTFIRACITPHLQVSSTQASTSR